MKHFIVSVYILCVALLSIHAFHKQEYNWDTLPYMAVVLSYENHDANFVHDSVYRIAKQQIPTGSYQLLTDGGLEMRKQAFSSALYFQQQLPYYAVKPLYTKIVYWFYKRGTPLLKAVLIPSVASYFLTGVFIFFWIKKYASVFLSSCLSVLILLLRPVFTSANLATPDFLSALFLLFAFYFLLEENKLFPVCLFLILSISARLDNIVPSVVIILSLRFTDIWKQKISLLKIGSLLLIMAAYYLMVSSGAKKYGWSLWYYPEFISHLSAAYNNSSFSFSNYFAVMRSQIITGLVSSELTLFLFLSAVLIYTKNISRSNKLSPDDLLLLTCLVIITIRFILQPVIADRFYVAYYIIVLILVVKKISTRIQLKPVPK
jgi:hypothetical protein